MSLSIRDQEALASIEKGLAGADPKLASMLAMFTRLAEGERMPPHESAGRARYHGGARAHGRPCHGDPRQHEISSRNGVPSQHGVHAAALLLWVLLAVALIVTMAVVTHGGAGNCSAGSPLACAGNVMGAAGHSGAPGSRSR